MKNNNNQALRIAAFALAPFAAIAAIEKVEEFTNKIESTKKK